MLKTAKGKNPKKLRRKYIALGRIYAYKPSGDYIEYKDIFEASEKLNTELEILYKIIKNNSNKISGFVFTTDSDY